MRDGKGGDYFKANAIREKCTVGKCSGRAPFILTLCACGVGDATSVSMTEEELCSRRQRKRGGVASVDTAHSKRAGVFSRLVQSVLRRMRQESLPSFPPPLPSFVYSRLTPPRRSLAWACERASVHPRDCQRSLPLSPHATRRWGRRARAAAVEATVGRRRRRRSGGGGVAGRLVFQTRGMMMMHRLLPTDGRTDG